MAEKPYLEMCAITKTFPGVVALDHVDFTCSLGEVHALVGENGAGKSTLMNLLGGLLVPTEGTISLNGAKVTIASPGVAYASGIGFVHQESNLLPNLTVTENIFLAHELTAHGRLDRVTMAHKVEEMNCRLGYRLPPDALVESLKLADQQLTEITRALMGNPKLLIMDEPTAALSEDEVKRLFFIIENLRKSGVGIIYISHRLEEVSAVADRVTVLKDGKNAGELSREALTRDKMISMMVGRTLTDIYPERSAVVPGEELLKVEHLTIQDSARDVSFSVRAGEILGLGGLEGQGQRETVRAIFGDVPFSAGSVTVLGKAVPSGGIGRRIESGLGYVTHDRRGEGLVLHESIRKNVALASLKKLRTAWGVISGTREKQEVSENATRLQIKSSSLEETVGNLSGGNQQKVMLARWLMVNPRVLIVDEPTKGIDVGARMSVYKILHDLTLEGIAVVMLTSDMLELIGLSDRILVFYEGKIIEELPRAQATEERLMRAASGGTTGKEGSTHEEKAQA